MTLPKRYSTKMPEAPPTYDEVLATLVSSEVTAEGDDTSFGVGTSRAESSKVTSSFSSSSFISSFFKMLEEDSGGVGITRTGLGYCSTNDTVPSVSVPALATTVMFSTKRLLEAPSGTVLSKVWSVRVTPCNTRFGDSSSIKLTEVLGPRESDSRTDLGLLYVKTRGDGGIFFYLSQQHFYYFYVSMLSQTEMYITETH